MSLTYAEFCAGYGGLGLAVESVFGASLKWYSEFDPAPSKIMAHHWPGVPNYGDMTAIDWAAVEPVDILSGGTPCQDLSAAGRRKGMTEGTRSNLWVHMREAIAVIKPRFVVWENVRGAYSAEASSDLEQCPGCVGDTSDGRVFLRALGRVLGDLSDLGYDCQWRGLRVADVGGCHGRFRVFVFASHRDSARRIEHGRPEPIRAEHAAPEYAGSNAAVPGRLQRLTGRNAAPKQKEKGGASGEYSGRSGTSAVWGEYGPAVRRWENALGRPAPAPTEPNGRSGRQRLSPRFTEWMMGLADGWVTAPEIGLTRNEQLKACGNGVVPQQAAAALYDMATHNYVSRETEQD